MLRQQIFSPCSGSYFDVSLVPFQIQLSIRGSYNSVCFDYSIQGTSLERQSEMKDLGVIYDSKLSFTSHINDLYSKCIKLVGFIFRTSSDFRNATTVLALFNSLIRSKLEYSSTIWNPSSQSSKYLIEKLQKKVVKYLFFKNFIPNAPVEFNYLVCLKILGIDSLEKRRILTDLKDLIWVFAE